MVKRPFSRRSAPDKPPEEPGAREARAAAIIEESRELVVVLDANRDVVAASRRARESLEGVRIGSPFPEKLLEPRDGHDPLEVPYDLDGKRETLVYLGSPGDLAAYEELRAGFTAAVSHELRTPLTRLMVLLESFELPNADTAALASGARAEVDQIRELIDDVLFLSELESGRVVVSLGSTRACPVLEQALARRAERAERAGVALRLECLAELELPLRPRMLEIVATNLTDNAIRYAGDGSTFTLAARVEGQATVLSGSDDGAGVSDEDLPRLFERFFRSDRARSSHGTGLGLAIVKHVITAAGGSVEARGSGGLEIRCVFPTPQT